MERNKIIYGGQTLIDLTDATATASDILSGKTAYGADGSLLVGTNTSSEWTSGIYMDEDGYIRVSPLAGAGGVIFEDGYLVFSPNAGDVTVVTTPTYMWKDTNDYVHFSSVFHNGYQINVTSVTENHSWVTVWNITNSNWNTSYENTYYSANIEEPLFMNNGGTYKITFDGTPYEIEYDVNSVVGTALYNWDGTSPVDYPFGFFCGSPVELMVTTNEPHTIVIEYWE